MSPPRVMGVVNATPDSFSDGGLHATVDEAVLHGRRLAAEGADVVDVGGESTRPGAREVPLREELARVIPVVHGLVGSISVPVSVDTRKAAVAAAALDAGATWVNDVSAGTFDDAMLPLVAEAGCTYVAMHARGLPHDMQQDPRYDDPVAEVRDELAARVAACIRAGIDRSRLVVDPGIGFGKRLEDNLALLRNLPALRSLGLPLLVGVSRKGFLATLTGKDEPARRLGGTAAAVAACVLGGADYVRVHDVAFLADVVRVAAALRPTDPEDPGDPTGRNAAHREAPATSPIPERAP